MIAGSRSPPLLVALTNTVLVALLLLLRNDGSVVRGQQQQQQEGTTPSSSSSSGLKERYEIGGPEYEYDDLQFDMDYLVSDYIRDDMVGYALHDGLNCKDGGDRDITENDGYLSSKIRTDNAPPGDGSTKRTVKVTMRVEPQLIVDSGLYISFGSYGTVEFCVRFSVYTGDKNDPDSLEVNFLETPVRLTINLSDGFSLDLDLSNADAIVNSAYSSTAVEAYVCDQNGDVIPIVVDDEILLQQGQTVRTCVSPTPENLGKGARMKHIEEFEFARGTPFEIASSVSSQNPGGVIRKSAIDPNTNGEPADQLTVVSCQPGSTVCAIETLLPAEFFKDGSGTVTGTGTAYLQIDSNPGGTASSFDTTRRKERRSRSLLEVGEEIQYTDKTANEMLSAQPTAYTVQMTILPVEKHSSEYRYYSSATARLTLSFRIIIISTAIAAANYFLLC